MRHRNALFGGALALALFGVALGCATNPVTGKSQINLVSESQELAAGKQALAATESEYGYYEDAGWSTRVSGLGTKLAAVSHRPQLPWEFHVIDDASVNAFAAPGGYIFVTRGILAHLNSEAQLAGVLGHEIGHVTARHYAQAASRQTLANLGLGVAGIISPTAAKFGQVAQAGLGILFLKYSRDQENESDNLGVQYSVKAGWDAREMPATYRTLARISAAAGSSIPNYLSTHPDPAAREGTVRQLAATAVAGRTDLKVNRDSYLRSLDGMVFGEDPQQGYFEGDRFYHPGLTFQMDFPAGWKHQNTHQTVMAGAPDQSAVMQLSLVSTNNLSPSQYVSQLQSSGRIARAEGRSETVNGAAAWIGRIYVQDEQGQTGSLAYALINQASGRAFQVLGQTQQAGSGDEQEILASARSIRRLTDANRLSASPAHLRVAAATKSGSFASVVAAMGSQGATIDQLAIINGVETDDPIRSGQLLKLVTPGRLR
jgi:predicted Zn-dependent protease